MDFDEAKIKNDYYVSLLVTVRKSKRISQYRLAELTGLSRQAIRIIENGKVTPTLVSLILIADALEVKLFDVFDEAE